MVCSRCGSELTPGSLICGACGAVVSAPDEAELVEAPPSLPRTDRPAARPASAAPAASPSSQKRPVSDPSRSMAENLAGVKGRNMGVALLGVVIACVVVVLLLGFVGGPKWFSGGGAEPSGPEQTMNAFFQALIDRDAAAVISLTDPAGLQQLESPAASSGYSLDQYMKQVLKQANPNGDLQISDLTYQTEISGDEATVKITGGKAVYTNAQGTKVTETPQTGGNVLGQDSFKLRNVDGRWYILPGA